MLTEATPPAGDELDQAAADVMTARAVVTALRERVALGLDGAASLATAEWRLHVALRRQDEARRLSSVPFTDDAPDPAA